MALHQAVSVVGRKPVADRQRVIDAFRLSRTDAERPTPSARQERVADAVFSRDQERFGALFLGLHAGLPLAHRLAVETFREDGQEDAKPRKSGCRCCRT